MTIRNSGVCSDCGGEKPANSWIEVGEQVHIAGGRAGDTNHTFYQCSSCGTLWVKIQDVGGIGGNATFFRSLTSSLYPGEPNT